MRSTQLNKLLEELREAIRNTGEVDQKGREILIALDADIHDLLQRDDPKSAAQGMVQRMKSAIEHFEVTHPMLTAMISELSAILNNAGI